VVTRLEGLKEKIRFVSGHLFQILGNQAKKKGQGESKKGVGRLPAVLIFFAIRIPGAGEENQVLVIMIGWVLDAAHLHGL